MSEVSVRGLLNDNVDSSQGDNTSSVEDKVIVSHQDQTKTELLSSLLPPLHSSSLPPVRPPSDRVFLQAAAFFQQLHTEKSVAHQRLLYGKTTNAPVPENGDKPTQEQAYQLAFNTLKYQDLLEDIVADSRFHVSQQISSDLLPLAMVMLFDFQDRKFSLRERSTNEGQEVIQEVKDLEGSLQRCKTKLAASLARCRVKQSLQSVSCFLSKSVRTKHHRAKGLPVYAWINTLTTSLEEVCEALRSAGLREAANVAEVKESAFCRDPLCSDTLVFSRRLHAPLQHSGLHSAHVLNIQDRSVCVAVSALRPLLFEKGDVLVAGSFSALTVAHIAAAAAARSGRVLVCGPDHTPSQVEEMQELLTQMDLKNVRVLPEAFCSLHEWDASVQRLKVVMVLPRCSSSALNDPVPTIYSEHGDWDLLPDLSHGSVSKSKMHNLTTQQARLLAHALTFSKVQTAVYCTRSVHPEENEQLVKRVLEKTHTPPKLLPFRVNGPVFPDDSLPGDAAEPRFFRLRPSQFTNGCFIARLSRQADPTKVDTVQDVLARAVAKGLLGGIISEQSKTGKKGKGKKNRAASAGSRPSSPSSDERRERDPAEEESGEGDFKDSEEEGDDKGAKGKKKKRGRKRHSKLAKKAGAPKKKPTKRKPNQQHHKKHPSRSKPRRIPRLTLTLMSSSKPPSHLSPITALAHKLIVNPAAKAQQSPPPAGKHPSPARPAPPGPRRQNSQHERAEKTSKDAAKPGRRVVRPGNVDGTQEALKAADFVLPPISSPSSCSLRSRSGSSLYQPPSHTSNSQLANMSASSSLVSLPGL